MTSSDLVLVVWVWLVALCSSLSPSALVYGYALFVPSYTPDPLLLYSDVQKLSGPWRSYTPL